MSSGMFHPTHPALLAVASTLILALHGCGGDGSDADTRGADSAQPATGEPSLSTPPANPQPMPTDPAGSATAPAGAAAATTAAAGGAASGPDVYKTYCVTCHGATGQGEGPAAAALEPKPASFAAGDFKFDPNGNGKKGEIEDIIAVVRDGAAKHGGSPLMAPWAMLSPEQLQAVAEHVQSFSKG